MLQVVQAEVKMQFPDSPQAAAGGAAGGVDESNEHEEL